MLTNPEPQYGINCTINTTEDCNLRCKYDVSEGTKILMSDFSEKNIEDIKPGDEIIGFTENPEKNKQRVLFKTKVIDCGKTRSLTDYYSYKTENGNILFASGEHPVINGRNKFQKTEDFYKSKEKNKYVLEFYKHKNVASYKRQKVEVKKIHEEVSKNFYNMTTESHTFIANGIFVHNCYEVNKRKKYLKLEDAYRFIDLLIDTNDLIGSKEFERKGVSPEKEGIVLDFIGGDALMNVDQLDKIMTYFNQQIFIKNTENAKNWRGNTRFSISSNGCLFDKPEVRAFCEKWREMLSVGVSIDGCPEIHDKYRIMKERGPNGEEIGSMNKILEWWSWYQKIFPKDAKGTKATCSKDSIPYLYESLVFMHENLGIDFISQNFIMEDTHCTDEDYIELDKQLRKCCEYVLNHCEEMFWSMIEKGFAEHSLSKGDNWSEKGHCGSGSMPCLGINGKIYPCFRWLPHTQAGYDGPIVVGDLEKGFYNKAGFEQVRRGACRANCTRNEKCRTCEYEDACHYCIAGCYSEFGDFVRTTYICEITKLQCKWAKVYWNEYAKLKGTPMRYPEEFQLDTVKPWKKED